MSDQSAPGGTPLPEALVSVIIRTKDRPHLLERALRSVVAQDHRPVEVVLVNDGQTALDALGARYRSGLQDLRIVVPPAPGGRSAAANAGLAAALGDYLIFLDDDDWFYPGHIARLVTALQQDSTVALAYAGVECCRQDPDTGELRTEHVFDQSFEPAFFLIQNFIPMHAALFRRSLLDATTRFDEELDYYEDWDFWLQLKRKTAFVHVPGVSACYWLDSSGFGVEQTQRQRAAEQRFFARWRQRWTPGELQLIVDYARRIPALRQEAHEQLLQLSRQAEAQQAELASLQALHHDAQVTVARQREELVIASSQQLNLQDRLLALQAHLRSAEDQLSAVLASKSWRLTRPLRVAARLARNGLRLLRLALGILREEGAAALLARLRQRLQAPAALVSAVLDEPAAVPLRVILPEQHAAAAAAIALPESTAPRVSVIIPVWNHVGLTLACLQSLQEHLPSCSLEVILVDDASTDDTQALLQARPGLRYLRNTENGGFIVSCNRGAAAARGEYLFFLNNDTELRPGWLDPLVDLLDRDPRSGIAGSKLIYPSGHLQEAGACLRANGTVDLVGLNGDPRDPRYNYTRPVDHCSGAAILVRAALFRELGGFDLRYAPAYFEDCDLSLKVQEAGYKVMYVPASEVVHHLSVTTGSMPGGKLEQIARNRERYLERWHAFLAERDKVRLIAFYLPQFHPIPENDAWWGKGFTEWTNVARAQPQFDGHVQPQRPGELGYYDLRLPEVRAEQARLAREYGIHGFCYYYYWFDGKRLLEKPLDAILQSGEPDLPFCVCWANENWTRRWDGHDAEVLMAQNYTPESNLRFMQDLLPVLRDPRYIRIAGRPLLLIYRADLITGLADAVPAWRQLVRAAGLGELYLAAVESFGGVREDLVPLFDALVEFPPHARSMPLQVPPRGLKPEFAGTLYDYAASSEAFLQRKELPPQLFRTAMPSWDNTPRRQQAAHIHVGATPWRYQQWLAGLVKETRELRMGDERIVFVNAWNEWAEGNHLEPDLEHGRTWLEATRNALGPLGCYPDLRPGAGADTAS